MAWRKLAELRSPPVATTDFLYIRYLGDRTIQEKGLCKIQRGQRSCKRRKDMHKDPMRARMMLFKNLKN